MIRIKIYNMRKIDLMNVHMIEKKIQTELASNPWISIPEEKASFLFLAQQTERKDEPVAITIEAILPEDYEDNLPHKIAQVVGQAVSRVMAGWRKSAPSVEIVFKKLKDKEAAFCNVG